MKWLIIEVKYFLYTILVRDQVPLAPGGRAQDFLIAEVDHID